MTNEKAILCLKNRTLYRGKFPLPVTILTLNHQIRSITFFFLHFQVVYSNVRSDKCGLEFIMSTFPVFFCI